MPDALVNVCGTFCVIARDAVKPVGGTPAALTSVLDVGDFSNRGGTLDKDILDIVLGVSQVVSRNLVIQANYSFSNESGYLNNGYKLIDTTDDHIYFSKEASSGGRGFGGGGCGCN